MTRPTQVNFRRHRKSKEPKTLIGSTKRDAVRLIPSRSMMHTDSKTAGVKAGAKSSCHRNQNMANPTSRLRVEAGASARNADGMAGRGMLEKAKAAL